MATARTSPRMRSVFSTSARSRPTSSPSSASQLAYIKPVTVGGEDVFAIHAADGTPMAVAPNRDLAWGAILEHEMVPALVN
jgi:hypothetical protein